MSLFFLLNPKRYSFLTDAASAGGYKKKRKKELIEIIQVPPLQLPIPHVAAATVHKPEDEALKMFAFLD